ncbi:hypothetical protein TNCV_3049321 [Trichonephila clavipes]|nr:hypothetical protein TNCV_3049321 [Trichonephila clavipes]
MICFDGVPQNQRDVQVAELAVPYTTVWRALWKRLGFKLYRYQIVQALKPTDKPLRLRGAEAADNCSVELHHRGYATMSMAGA